MWWAGLAVLGLAAFEWTVTAWAERATGDDRLNQRIRNRVLNPVEVPVAGALIIGFVVFGVSRVLLAVPAEVSVWLTIGFAALVFLVAVILAAVPHLARMIIGIVVGFAILAVLVGGIIGAANGERQFEEHPTEHNSYDTTVTTLEGNPQPGVVTTTSTTGAGS
jgi:4-hydroxybenzoate polyprenyltransferase